VEEKLCCHLLTTTISFLSSSSQVDRGINPETYTDLIINSAVERTARTRGRVLALEVFRDAIGAEMQRTMPDLWNQFQEQRSK
jgi:hypothetical protein